MNFERLTETLPEGTLGEVTLRVAQPEEIAAACAALEREHYLGAPRPCNREVVQLAVRGDQVLTVVHPAASATKKNNKCAPSEVERVEPKALSSRAHLPIVGESSAGFQPASPQGAGKMPALLPDRHRQSADAPSHHRQTIRSS